MRDRLLSSPTIRRLKSPMSRSLRAVGYELQPVEMSRVDHVRSLLSRGRVHTVLDVGANQGQYAGRMRANGFTGRIVSFEPGRQAFARLSAQARNDSRWDVHDIALGAASGHLALHLSANSVSSSLLDVTPVHVDAAPASRVVESEQVRVERLDDVLTAPTDGRPLWLKLDVQGYELAVLDGAPAHLARSSVVEVEVSFQALYGGGADYLTLLSRLGAEGFVPVDVRPGLRAERTGDLLQVDLVAAHRDLLA
jgi:FkbM family methyltransferase